MKRQISIKINATLIAQDKDKFQKILTVLEELENNGFIENRKIVFEEEDASKVFDILEKLQQ